MQRLRNVFVYTTSTQRNINVTSTERNVFVNATSTQHQRLRNVNVYVNATSSSTQCQRAMAIENVSHLTWTIAGSFGMVLTLLTTLISLMSDPRNNMYS